MVWIWTGSIPLPRTAVACLEIMTTLSLWSAVCVSASTKLESSMGLLSLWWVIPCALNPENLNAD